MKKLFWVVVFTLFTGLLTNDSANAQRHGNYHQRNVRHAAYNRGYHNGARDAYRHDRGYHHPRYYAHRNYYAPRPRPYYPRYRRHYYAPAPRPRAVVRVGVPLPPPPPVIVIHP